MPPITYQEVKEHPDTFLTMTGLTVEEFKEVLLLFGSAWSKEHVVDELGRGRPPSIASMQDRLLFILFYYKCYPLQQVLGFLFGISQERASESIKECTDVLLGAVRESGLAPERISEALKKSLDKIYRRITSSTEQSGPSSDLATKKSKRNSTAEKAINMRSRTT